MFVIIMFATHCESCPLKLQLRFKTSAIDVDIVLIVSIALTLNHLSSMVCRIEAVLNVAQSNLSKADTSTYILTIRLQLVQGLTVETKKLATVIYGGSQYRTFVSQITVELNKTWKNVKMHRSNRSLRGRNHCRMVVVDK